MIVYFFVLIGSMFMVLQSVGVQACETCDNACEPCCCEPDKWGVRVEARVAYYHPSSNKVRRIYGDGWADYQLEVSSKLGNLWGIGNFLRNWLCDGSYLRLCAGVSGFSRHGDSIGFHNRTNLQLLPVSLGLKYYVPIGCNTEFYLGGAGCYSFLRIRDHSEYVHEHVRKEAWGGLVQTGVTYSWSEYIIVSAFFDYFFQRFDFSSSDHNYGYGSSYYYGSRYIERKPLNMDGYKVGVGLGIEF